MIAVMMSAFMLTGCFSGQNVENAEQLHGRWNLHSNSWTTGFGRTTNTGGFAASNYIEFNENGTFSLYDYWWGSASGTWTFNAGNSTVTLNTTGFSVFAATTTRTIQITSDGTIQMEFDHIALGTTYSYRNRYNRA